MLFPSVPTGDVRKSPPIRPRAECSLAQRL